MHTMRILGFIFLVSITANLFAQDALTEDWFASIDTLKKELHAAEVPPPSTVENQVASIGRSRRADKLYSRMGYQASADLYRSFKSNKMNTQVFAKLAESYRMNSDPENAVYWYAKFIRPTSNAQHLLQYAQSLLANGNCEDATRWYQHYLNASKETYPAKIDFIQSCTELEEFTQHQTVKLKELPQVNSDKDDFAAVPFQNGIVFTSNRGQYKVAKQSDNWTNEAFSDLYFAERLEDGAYANPTILTGELNGRFHDGAAAFNMGESVLYFTRNSQKRHQKNGIVNLKIYSATHKSDNTWINDTELSFNRDDIASCHPTISSDGKRLYFASDREGGFGGMDIYVVENINGQWQMPINLGPTVNSAGNEIFPFIDANDVLYFASNGHKGMGGLDIFAVQKTEKTDELSWLERVHLGTPFNSNKDDFSFTINKSANWGFVSTNRAGDDNILEWTHPEALDLFKKPKVLSNECTLNVLEDATNMRIGDALVAIQDLSNPDEDPILMKTDKDGQFTYKVKPGRTYEFVVEQEGFEPLTKKIDAYVLLEALEDPKNLRIKRKSCTFLDGVVINDECDKPLADATIRLLNKCTGEELTLTSDSDGLFDACLSCDCEYEIIGTKDKFTTTTEFLKTIKKDCSKEAPMDVELHLSLLETKPSVVADLTGKEEELTIGKVIELKNIYYDFNDFKIRSDAVVDLDKVYNLMQAYPSMEIELGSHTDARGSDKYNRKLSQQRADAAIQYLIQKGISRNRIIAKGYGEMQPTNKCVNGIDCTESEHQLNRRTEIRILKM